MDSKEISKLMNQLNVAFNRVHELEYVIRRAKSSVNAKNNELNKASAALSLKESERQKLVLAVAELETSAAAVVEGLKRRREQMNMAKSNREFESLKLQIEMDESKNDRLADETLVAIANLEEADAALVELRKLCSEAQNSLKTAEEKFAAVESDSLRKLQEEKEIIRRLSASLPREFAEVLTRHVDDEEDPIAPVVDKSYCGSCNQALPPDVVLKVSAGAAICCSYCSKLLFVPESSDL